MVPPAFDLSDDDYVTTFFYLTLNRTKREEKLPPGKENPQVFRLLQRKRGVEADKLQIPRTFPRSGDNLPPDPKLFLLAQFTL